MNLAELNAAPRAKAAEVFTACCGSSRWVSRMISRRPFASLADLLLAANEVWASLDREDWLEAFAHHPRIGERTAALAQNERGAQWSSSEQSAVTLAPEAIREQQQSVNAAYERRFGYIYIVCATGKTPDEMLAIARQRLSNDPETEIEVAAEEQRKIMGLRLEKLLAAT
jgi:2-oxo-4-hydroxy-4-carboxy-5-ureidoimidazoline decarboxylase